MKKYLFEFRGITYVVKASTLFEATDKLSEIHNLNSILVTRETARETQNSGIWERFRAWFKKKPAPFDTFILKSIEPLS